MAASRLAGKTEHTSRPDDLGRALNRLADPAPRGLEQRDELHDEACELAIGDQRAVSSYVGQQAQGPREQGFHM